MGQRFRSQARRLLWIRSWCSLVDLFFKWFQKVRTYLEMILHTDFLQVWRWRDRKTNMADWDYTSWWSCLRNGWFHLGYSICRRIGDLLVNFFGRCFACWWRHSSIHKYDFPRCLQKIWFYFRRWLTQHCCLAGWNTSYANRFCLIAQDRFPYTERNQVGRISH